MEIKNFDTDGRETPAFRIVGGDVTQNSNTGISTMDIEDENDEGLEDDFDTSEDALTEGNDAAEEGDETEEDAIDEKGESEEGDENDSEEAIANDDDIEKSEDVDNDLFDKKLI